LPRGARIENSRDYRPGAQIQMLCRYNPNLARMVWRQSIHQSGHARRRIGRSGDGRAAGCREANLPTMNSAWALVLFIFLSWAVAADAQVFDPAKAAGEWRARRALSSGRNQTGRGCRRSAGLRWRRSALSPVGGAPRGMGICGAADRQLRPSRVYGSLQSRPTCTAQDAGARCLRRRRLSARRADIMELRKSVEVSGGRAAAARAAMRRHLSK
jgi:hypothetical protein